MSAKLLSRCYNLQDIGNGLASRVVFLGTNFPSGVLLTDPSILKIILRVERKFPDLTSLCKSSGYEVFTAKAGAVMEQLGTLAGVLNDIADFNTITLQTILDLSNALPEWDFLLSREYCIIFLSLIALQLKVNITLSRIVDAKKIYGTYASAYEISQGTADPHFEKISKLLLCLDGKYRFFVDSFDPVIEHVGKILPQLLDSLVVGNDSVSLRNSSALNPQTDNANIEVPSKANLNSIKAISLYTELADHALYTELVLYAYLACPRLLFRPEQTDIFRTVGSRVLCIKIHNGLSLNIHGELDNMSQVFPAKGEKFDIPKGFVFRSMLKEVAKEATKTCGLSMITRRAMLQQELATMNRLLTYIPGAMAPKFPQILALASLARAEVLSYFRHLNLQTRKECMKHLVSGHFKTASSDLPALLKELVDLTSTVQKGLEIVVLYYVEYLSRLDAEAMEIVQNELSAYVSDALKELITSVIQDIRSLRSVDFLSSPPLTLAHIRTKCMQIHAYIIQKSTEVRSTPIPSTTAFGVVKRLRAIIERTYMLDSLESKLLPEYFDPIELWYFRDLVLDSFLRTTVIKDVSVDGCTCVSFLRFTSTANQNIHIDCPLEASIICTSAVSLCDQMSLELANHANEILMSLEKEISNLDSQLLPVEAAYRGERMLIAKKSGSDFVEPLPGSESKLWAQSSIKELINLRSAITNLMQYTKKTGKFIVYNREYSPFDLIRIQIETYVSSRLFDIFGGKRSNFFDDLAGAIRSLSAICQTGQMAFSVMNMDFPIFFRQLLFSNFSPTSLSPPGSVLPTSISAGSGLIWIIADSIKDLIQTMASPKPEFTWIRPLNLFIKRNQHPHSKDDLNALCSLLGPQGVRAINCKIGELITTEAIKLKSFLSTNSSTLQELRRDFCTSINASHKLIKLSNFTNSLITIGIALAVRERFMLSLGESIDMWVPCVRSSIEAVVSSIDVWTDSSDAVSLCQLSADVGLTKVTSLKDVTLQAILREVLLSTDITADMRLFELLPVAFASTFLSDNWDNVSFDADKESFEGNEHAISIAVPKLIMSILGLDISLHTGQTPLSRVKEAAEAFVELSSHFLAVMRVQESESIYRHKPIRAMISIVESAITNYFPETVITRSTLEKYFPYALIHADYMDIALGKVKFGDKIDMTIFDTDDMLPPEPVGGAY